MTIDDSLGIEFGELEEAQPEVRLRPDANKHFAVAAVYSPHDGDLPIFVDLDAMRDMEEHAVSDTSVELGGVMLGGQYEDDAGRAFVLVTDSLRAQHYESTKGSFKFTHDTWAEITRQRDEFPEELQMVGWYHTHPDWSVFLSGMDMFICNNFFNKKLDVALVIDPCRHDRGFFQWSTNAGEDTGGPGADTAGHGVDTIRTGGFFLVASRFRQYELEEYANYLEGQFAMAGDPRFRGVSSGPAPIVNVGGQQPWQGVAVLGMLAMQFCFLMLLSWKLLLPGEAEEGKTADKDIAALQASIEHLAKTQRHDAEIDAKIEALDTVIRAEGDPTRLVESLAERTAQVKDWEQRYRHRDSYENELKESLTLANQQFKDAELREARLKNRLKKQEVMAEDQQREIALLEKKVAELRPQDEKGKDGDETAGGWNWRWILGGTAAVLAVLAVASLLIPKAESDSQDDSRDKVSKEEVKEPQD